MPPIWLVNGLEQPSNLSAPNANAARHYIPGWVLRPGFHTEAQAKLITKRLIKSSFLRDIVFNSKPAYTPISLYPIFESGMLTYPNTSIATATVRITLMPAFMYFRTQVAGEDYLHESKYPSYVVESCDYIDDYRLGTVLDVVGSVGGLFALLQAVHVLLFGRPLLWGLAGTKLLTPFGLLGTCSSKRFKQRLYEKYHKKPTEDDSDTIRITKFLSDFIVDFGPADHNPEGYSPPVPAPSPELVASSEHTTSAEM
ncbi:deuterolysin metalloprotease (M35) family containing protein, putative [Rhizoctonia solani AG-3 Rhs1AP]|uniref:Deuterolysin metalloprotease (M35) family containing protein, putative n=2 Tax=Rhizoctonia solani AG-3 TaxID=1086053 RepID=A0A0A1UHJ0_9AGAM|nr:deuterolysin metalloprotease (M35) family containing protein, putative [Rhizoctonia solani AG-3 Rhs1AP]KEP45838.1 putative deuterolysin metalloprotease (M35) family containing protein [Rhizoctonia solani 123E]